MKFPFGLFKHHSNTAAATPPTHQENLEQWTLLVQVISVGLGIRSGLSLDFTGAIAWSIIWGLSDKVAEAGYRNREQIKTITTSVMNDAVTYVKNKMNESAPSTRPTR